MSEYGIREIRAASASAAATAIAPAIDRRRELSPAAMLAATQTIVPAFSPIVLAGFVRMIELALMAAIGIAIYFAYVFPVYGFSWYYPLTAIGIAMLIVLALQTADIYHVQAFRTPFSECIRLAVAMSLLFLVVATIMFFAKRSEEHTSELQSRRDVVCRLLLEKKNTLADRAHPGDRVAHALPDPVQRHREHPDLAGPAEGARLGAVGLPHPPRGADDLLQRPGA